MGKIASSQSLAFSERSQLSQAISAVPRGKNTTPTMNANRAIRIAVQRTQGLRGANSVFLEGDMTANER